MEITKEMLELAATEANHAQLKVMFDAMEVERDAFIYELQKANAVIIDLQRNPPKYTQQHLAEIRAEAIEHAATYLSESMTDKSHESLIFKDRYVYISTRYLREHAETIRQGGAE